MKKRTSSGEVILWSIAFPGFGHLLNGNILKGFGFILLEFIINVQGNFNTVIFLSFQGQIREAIETVNIQWLMFYPCVYLFAIWDAYKETLEEGNDFLYLPFVFGAYFVTVGLILSPTLHLFNQLLGPIWLPMLFLLPGLGIGFLLRYVIKKVKIAS